MKIHILREPNTEGLRVEDDMEEESLIRTDGVEENENEHVTFVEYRFPGSDCIVHRSCHVRLKKWPDGISAVAQPLK